MPELPEVETTKRGISPFMLGETIKKVVVRQPQLRFKIPQEFSSFCLGKTIASIQRRAKYLIFNFVEGGYLLNHLGMSGRLHLCNEETTVTKHAHLDLILTSGYTLRYHDPRRFGLWLYGEQEPELHPLLAHLGPEPLSESFNSDYLAHRAQKRQQSIKAFLMNNEVVVGVGNIYATESLFFAGIHPQTPTKNLRAKHLERLVAEVKRVLSQAIELGGTTLRDFFGVDGNPGYFVNNLQVYGRKNQPCYRCTRLIQTLIIGQRASAFCPQCQNYLSG